MHRSLQNHRIGGIGAPVFEVHSLARRRVGVIEARSEGVYIRKPFVPDRALGNIIVQFQRPRRLEPNNCFTN